MSRPSPSAAQSRLRVALFAAAIFVATLLAAFAIPFLFRPHAVADGQSYVEGYNNRLATVLLLLLSLGVLLFFLRRGTTRAAQDDPTRTLYGRDTRFHALHQVYSDDLIIEELRRNWAAVATLGPGPTVLYRRMHSGLPLNRSLLFRSKPG